MSELSGLSAVVTGSARNIGRSIAETLAGAGASVVVNARRSRAEAEEVAAGINARGGRAVAVMADIAEPAGAAHLIEAAAGAFGRLDILVNNAALRLDAPVEDITYEDWRAVLASILDATFLCSQAAIPHLKAGGAGAIVNIGGVAAHVGVTHRAHVVAAKAGVAGLTRALAAELAPAGITVNCLAPGRIETAREGELPLHFRERPVPLGRGGRPDEVAAMVRHLAGPNGRFITGQTVHINGGWHMG
jgi:3-oxoacyl-[acyl-carrier protein] reductase